MELYLPRQARHQGMGAETSSTKALPTRVAGLVCIQPMPATRKHLTLGLIHIVGEFLFIQTTAINQHMICSISCYCFDTVLVSRLLLG